jgi:hypothetical protein
VPVHEFVFALELSDGARFEAMLTDLARAVLHATDCPPEAVPALTGSLRQALSDAGRGRARCNMRFHAQGGELHIGISCAGQPERRSTFTLPNP